MDASHLRALGVTAAYIQTDMDAENTTPRVRMLIHLRHRQRVPAFDYLRDNMKIARTTTEQLPATAPGRTQRSPLRHHRRGGQHPDRRKGADAAHHQRPGNLDARRFAEAGQVARSSPNLGAAGAGVELARRRRWKAGAAPKATTSPRSHRRPGEGGPAEPAAEGRLLRDQGEGAYLPPDRRGRAEGGEAGRASEEASTPPATWSGRT